MTLEGLDHAIHLALLLEGLDHAIHLALLFGSIEWHSAGKGNNMPGIPVFRFFSHTSRHGARLDFFRGVDQDDLLNKEWSAWFRRLPNTMDWLKQQHRMTSSEHGDGNRMEEFAGIAYTTYVHHHNLPRNMTIEYQGGEKHKEAWRKVWLVFRELGLPVTITDANIVPLGTRASGHQCINNIGGSTEGATRTVPADEATNTALCVR